MSLTKLGEAKVADIAKKANVARTTTFSILERLTKEGLVSEHHYKGVAYYWVESPQIIKSVYENKMRLAEGLAETLSDLYRSDANFPFAKVYDSKNAVKNFIEKIMSDLPKNATIYTIDAPHMGNYVKIFSNDYYEILLKTKKKRGVQTKTLIPFGTKKDIDPEKMRVQEIEIREMPENIKFSASLWLIDDLLVLFSGKPPFIVSIRHELIVQSVKSLYDDIWRRSG
jgi:sugar-specific transcriptional regulator TrmB